MLHKLSVEQQDLIKKMLEQDDILYPGTLNTILEIGSYSALQKEMLVFAREQYIKKLKDGVGV